MTDETSSQQRYKLAMASEAKAEAKRIAEQEKADRIRQETERRRLAEAEKKRRDDEERRKKEAERQEMKESTDPETVASNESTPPRRPGFGGIGRGPRSMGPAGRFGAPRFGPSGRSPNAGTSNRRSRPAMPAPGPNDVIISVSDASALAGRELLSSRPDWLRKYPISASHSGGKLIVRISNFDRELSELKKAYPQLQFDAIDEDARTILASRASEL